MTLSGAVALGADDLAVALGDGCDHLEIVTATCASCLVGGMRQRYRDNDGTVHGGLPPSG